MRGGPQPQQRAGSQDARDAPQRCASFDSMKLSAWERAGKNVQTRVTKRQKPLLRSRKMETLSLSVNGVSYTVAAELAPTNDPFNGPIKSIAQWNFTILAVLMFVVTSLSLCENFLVMFITFKFKQLRQPLNYIIVNLAIADFLVSITGGLISFLTNARGYFFLGRWACVLEGFAVTFFGKSPASVVCGPGTNCRCQCWNFLFMSDEQRRNRQIKQAPKHSWLSVTADSVNFIKCLNKSLSVNFLNECLSLILEF